MWLAVALTLLAVPAPRDDATPDLERLEAALLAARTVQIEFEATVEGKEKERFTGFVKLQRENRLRVQLVEECEGRPLRVNLIADGERMADLGGPMPMPPNPQPAPKTLNRDFLIAFARAGIASQFFAVAVPAGQEDEADQPVRVSDVRPLSPATFAGRNVQVIEHKLTFPLRPGVYTSTVWFDAKTGLPVRRVITGGEGEDRTTITETYPRLLLDERVDPLIFEITR